MCICFFFRCILGSSIELSSPTPSSFGIMATSRELIKEVEATSTYLRSLKDTKIVNQATTIRATRLSNLIGECHFDAHTAAGLITTIRASELPETIKDSLMNAINEKLLAPAQSFVKPSKGDQKLQDFTSLPAFLPAGVWESEHFAEDLAKLAASIGLEHPNEDTAAVLAAMVATKDHGFEEALQMKFTPLHDYVIVMKQKIKKWAAILPAGIVKIKVLPHTPDALLLKHPKIYRFVYSEDKGPIRAPFDPTRFEILVNMVPRRKSHAGLRAEEAMARTGRATAMHAMIPGNGMAGPGNNCMEMMASFFQAFGGMQMNQNDGYLPGLTINRPGGGGAPAKKCLADNPTGSWQPSSVPVITDGPTITVGSAPQAAAAEAAAAVPPIEKPELRLPEVEPAAASKGIKRISVMEATDLIATSLKKCKKGKPKSDTEESSIDGDEEEEVEKKKPLPGKKKKWLPARTNATARARGNAAARARTKATRNISSAMSRAGSNAASGTWWQAHLGAFLTASTEAAVRKR